MMKGFGITYLPGRVKDEGVVITHLPGRVDDEGVSSEHRGCVVGQDPPKREEETSRNRHGCLCQLRGGLQYILLNHDLAVTIVKYFFIKTS